MSNPEEDKSGLAHTDADGLQAVSASFATDRGSHCGQLNTLHMRVGRTTSASPSRGDDAALSTRGTAAIGPLNE